MSTARLARLVTRSLVGVVAAGLLSIFAAPAAEATPAIPAAHLQPYPTTYSVPDASLVNVGSKMCLTIAGGTLSDNNRQAVQYYCDTDRSRHWQIYGSGGSVQIKNIKTGKCLTVAQFVAGQPVNTNIKNQLIVQDECDQRTTAHWTMREPADTGRTTPHPRLPAATVSSSS